MYWVSSEIGGEAVDGRVDVCDENGRVVVMLKLRVLL